MPPSQSSPTYLSDELETIIRSFAPAAEESFHLTGSEPYYAIKESDLPKLLAAITAAYAEAIRSAVPEKPVVYIGNPSEHYQTGYNAAIDTFTANLQRESLLPTNASDKGS